MSELFLNVVNMSVSASRIILAVMLIRLIFKSLPKRINIILWAVVAIRLLLPFSIESVLSLMPKEDMISLNYTNAPHLSGQVIINNVINQNSDKPLWNISDSSAITVDSVFIISVIWLTVAFAMIIYSIISYVRLQRRVDTAILYKDNIYLSENVTSPFVLGILKPKIYLPFNMDDTDSEYVIAHEKAHISRRDHWWKFIGFLILNIHWFNPFVWISYKLFCCDIELACDEKVIKDLENDSKADYTEALVACSVNKNIGMLCPLSFGEVGVKQRVKSIMNYKKPQFWGILVSAIVCIIVCICFLTDPVKKSFDIKIAIPPENTDEIVYADEMIIPKGNYIKITADSGLDDYEVVLVPQVSGNEHSENISSCIAPGMSAKLKTRSGMLYKVGIKSENNLKIDKTVYLKVENVDVQIPQNDFGIVKWVDFSGDSSQMDWDNEMSISLKEIPNVTFTYTPKMIVAHNNFDNSDIKGHTILISGNPIWNVYFADFTGDNIADIVASYNESENDTSRSVIVYDYVNSVSYKLSASKEYDYYLRMNYADGYLYIDKKIYNSDHFVSSGRLVYKDHTIQIEEDDISLVNPNPRYYLNIGIGGIYNIEIHMPNSSEGFENADGSEFKVGDRLWLESLDGYTDLRGIEIIARNKSGEIIYSESVENIKENEGVVNIVSKEIQVTTDIYR